MYSMPSGPNSDVAAVVVGVGLLRSRAPACAEAGSARVGIASSRGSARRACRPSPVGVVHVEEPVGRVVADGRPRQQALLAAGADAGREVEERRREELAVATMRIRPGCSTTNSRGSPAGAVT